MEIECVKTLKDVANKTIDYLSENFYYKKILIVGMNDAVFKNILDVYKFAFGICFADTIIADEHSHFDCVIMCDNEINYHNIDFCKQNDIKIIAISNNYLPIELMGYLFQCNALMKMFLINECDKNNKINSICCGLIDELYCNLRILESDINNLFYNTSVNMLENEDILGIINNENECHLSKLLQMWNTVEYNFVDYVILNNETSLSKWAYKFIVCQMIVNVYINFIKNISPTLIGKVNNYSFNEPKFWFIKKHYGNSLVLKAQKLQLFIEQIKCEMIRADVEFYFNLAKEYNNFSFKGEFYRLINNYQNVSLFKIMNEMGVANF